MKQTQHEYSNTCTVIKRCQLISLPTNPTDPFTIKGLKNPPIDQNSSRWETWIDRFQGYEIAKKVSRVNEYSIITYYYG